MAHKSDLPELNSIFQGEIATLQDYGVFVKIPGGRLQGLVHISQMSASRIEHPSEVNAAGDRVYCKIISIERVDDRDKIALSMKVVNQTTGADLDPNNTGVQRPQESSGRRQMAHKSDLPELNSIFQGEIATLQDYGVFVKIPGGKLQGLVHISQMSAFKIEHPSEVNAAGDRVYCKIISIERVDDRDKIALSMKVVNQTTGADLDPNNVQISQDEQRRKSGHKRDIPRIELGAVLNTTCSKCGGKGHFAQDCFHQPGAQMYELVDDDEEYPPAPTESAPVKDKKHKHKKEKKKKKHKEKSSKRKCDSSESSIDEAKKQKDKSSKRRHHHSSDGSDDEPKHKRKKSKSHKKKSHHHSSS